ncbi:uncharacterized protein TNCV_4647491 [Trichonephila clavipes]|uniref:Uncharacterized protein n=1 Tax=Trichonephila clavipes TaxID=2585209 RepID=A0A8X6ST87_TRICX|nr:uncharacterized protein TNCV_4647491 [Trichonephila clavipes]
MSFETYCTKFGFYLQNTLGGLYIIYSWITRLVIRTAFSLFGYSSGLTYVNKERPRQTTVEKYDRFIPGNDCNRLVSAVTNPFTSLQSSSLSKQLNYAMLGLCFQMHNVLSYLIRMLQENETVKTKRLKLASVKTKRTKLIVKNIKRPKLAAIKTKRSKLTAAE